MNFCLIFFITGCLAITVLAGGGSYCELYALNFIFWRKSTKLIKVFSAPTSPPPTPPPSEDPSEDFSSDSSEESSSYFSENSSSSPSPSEDPKCKIIKKLEKCFPKEQLADWTCLVENESTFRTHIMSTNDNGSHDYGLFQINDGFWCKKGKKGGDCKMDCNSKIIWFHQA